MLASSELTSIVTELMTETLTLLWELIDDRLLRGSRLPDTLDDEAPGALDDEAPDALDDEAPGTLDEEAPGTPDDEAPTTLEDETPGTLEDGEPGTLDDELPTIGTIAQTLIALGPPPACDLSPLFGVVHKLGSAGPADAAGGLLPQ